MSEQRIYDALVLPSEALDKGGVEILRAGLIEDELYVTARRVFTDPATWGEVLADIARRLALLHSVEGEYEEAEVLAMIESAFAADLGAPLVGEKKAAKARAKKSGKKSMKKPAKKSVKARGKSAKRKSAKRSKR